MHTQCWEDVKTLPAEENSQTPVILRSSTDTSYLKDRFFVLVRLSILFNRRAMIISCMRERTWAFIHPSIHQRLFHYCVVQH